MISISTKYEDQQKLKVSMSCICNYDDGRAAAVSKLILPPSDIGETSVMFSINVNKRWKNNIRRL